MSKENAIGGGTSNKPEVDDKPKKPSCRHEWQKRNSATLRCSKCGKTKRV